MTTTASGRKITSACNGVTNSFTCPELTSLDALKVFLLDAIDDANDDGELLAIDDDYEVVGDYHAGTAHVQMAVAPANGKFLRRFRETPRAQEADYVANDGFPADVHEFQLDRLSHIVEELDDDLAGQSVSARAVLVPADESGIVLQSSGARNGLFAKFVDGGIIAADPVEDLDTPNFSVVLNVLPAGSPDSAVLTGAWPDKTITFNIARGADGASGSFGNANYGDITGGGSGTTLTINARAVSFAKLQAIATAKILGRTSGGAGDVEELSYATVKGALALDQVNNTSDANKPVSTAQQAALDLKQNKAPDVTTSNAPASPQAIDGTKDLTVITALAGNLTLSAPTGGVQGFGHVIRIKDNGVSRTLTWNAIYRALSGVTLPTATTAGKTHYIYMIYNSTDAKWDVVACKVEA